MRDPQNSLSNRDLELLSASLDGALSVREQAALNERLAHEPALRRALANLRQTRAVLRSAPQYKAPRSYILTPEMVPQRSAGFNLFGVMRMASLVAMVLFALVTTSDVLFSTVLSSTLQRNAPAAESVMMAEKGDANFSMNDAMEAAPMDEEGFVEKSGEAPLPSPQATVNVDSEDRGTADDAAEESADESVEDAAGASLAQDDGSGDADRALPTSEVEQYNATESQEGYGEVAPGEGYGGAEPPSGTILSQGEGEEPLVNPYEAVEIAPEAAEATSQAPTFWDSIGILRILEGGLLLVALAAGLIAWRLRERSAR